MSIISMIPPDGTVVIDGEAAHNVNFSSIDPSIAAIQWMDTYGWLEYNTDWATEYKPPNQRITSLDDYMAPVAEAQQIIFLQNNPILYFSTVNGLLYGDNSYALGQEIEITHPSTPQPPNTTTQVPPTPEDFQTLYWYNNVWVISSVNPALDLVSAKQALITEAQQSGAINVNMQASAYSFLQLATDGNPGILPCTGSPSTTLQEYQDLMTQRVDAKVTAINNATSVPALYGVDPTIPATFG
jgi:hypothetical protein